MGGRRARRRRQLRAARARRDPGRVRVRRPAVPAAVPPGALRTGRGLRPDRDRDRHASAGGGRSSSPASVWSIGAGDQFAEASNSQPRSASLVRRRRCRGRARRARPRDREARALRRSRRASRSAPSASPASGGGARPDTRRGTRRCFPKRRSSRSSSGSRPRRSRSRSPPPSAGSRSALPMPAIALAAAAVARVSRASRCRARAWTPASTIDARARVVRHDERPRDGRRRPTRRRTRAGSRRSRGRAAVSSARTWCRRGSRACTGRRSPSP